MNNTEQSTLVIIENYHPLFKTINSLYETKSPDEALASFETFDLIIDLSILRTKKKLAFLQKLARTTQSEIISDLSLSWAENIFKHCPRVHGALSLLFFSPTNAVEYSASSPQIEKYILAFLSKIKKEGIEHKNLTVGFHYPRVIAMIINEAYFALEENLASPESIDLAMKNGVGYPLGPLEWGEKIGLHYIIELLFEYAEITEDPRYRVSRKLKMMGSQK